MDSGRIPVGQDEYDKVRAVPAYRQSNSPSKRHAKQPNTYNKHNNNEYHNQYPLQQSQCELPNPPFRSQKQKYTLYERNSHQNQRNSHQIQRNSHQNQRNSHQNQFSHRQFNGFQQQYQQSWQNSGNKAPESTYSFKTKFEHRYRPYNSPHAFNQDYNQGQSNEYQGLSNEYQRQSNEYQRHCDEYQKQFNEYQGHFNEYQGQSIEYQVQSNEYQRQCDDSQKQSNKNQRQSNECQRQSYEYQSVPYEYQREGHEHQRETYEHQRETYEQHTGAGVLSSEHSPAEESLFMNYNAKKKNIPSYEDRNDPPPCYRNNTDPPTLLSPGPSAIKNDNNQQYEISDGNERKPEVNSSYSMPVQKYKNISEEPPKSTKPDPFAKTLAMYASTWMKNKIKTRMPSESSDTSNLSNHLRLYNEGDSGDFPIKKEKMLELAPYLHVDLNSLSPEHFHLTICYFKSHRTIRQFYYRKILKIDEKFKLDDVYDSDEECVPDDTLKYLVDKNPDYLADVKPIKSHKNHKNCDVCLLWSLPEREYMKHINTDLHLLLTDQRKLPPFSGAKRYDIIWCFACSCYFMLNFNGNTLVGHQQNDKHVKLWKLFGTRHKKSLNVRDFCHLTDLQGTMIYMLPPSDSRYQHPKEAYASYTHVYNSMSSRGLVIT